MVVGCSCFITYSSLTYRFCSILLQLPWFSLLFFFPHFCKSVTLKCKQFFSSFSWKAFWKERGYRINGFACSRILLFNHKKTEKMENDFKREIVFLLKNNKTLRHIWMTKTLLQSPNFLISATTTGMLLCKQLVKRIRKVTQNAFHGLR